MKMRPPFNWLLLMMLFPLFFQAQESQNSETDTLIFKLLRQDDKIAVQNPKNTYEKIKDINLGNKNSLSFGGSYRFQAESYINEDFKNTSDQDNLWLLHRTLVHAHYKAGDRFEIFGELNSSLTTGKENPISVDKNELNVNQLFARYRFNDQWNILAGRQNMRLGSGRLIDVREGPNVRLSFDMAQLQFKNKNTEITGFHAIPVQIKPFIFDDNDFDTNETLTALIWKQNWTERSATDFYILYKKENDKKWSAAPADDKRTSIGIRHSGKWNSFIYDNEFVYQFGKFGSENISAWTASLNIQKEFESQQPFNIGLKAAAISGDKSPGDSTLSTFDALYPRGAYFGKVAKFGPSNLIDVHPYLSTKLGSFDLVFDYDAFWRFSKNDGIYGPSLNLDFPPDNQQRFIAHQIGAVAGYEVNKFTNLELESNIIFPGAFLKESNNRATLYHFVLTAEFKF